MLILMGFMTMAVIMFLLLKEKAIPTVAFTVVPIAAAIIVGAGPSDISDYVKSGMNSVWPTAALFMFSVTFFGVMQDVGLFDTIINGLLKKTGATNVTVIALITSLVAMISHLDGVGASSFLITIPAMLPIWKKLKMRLTSMTLIIATSCGVLNLVSWAGPTARAASVAGIDANDLWKSLIPMQAVGVVLCFLLAYLVGQMEKRRGAKYDPAAEDIIDNSAEMKKKDELRRPKLIWVNALITVATILVLTFVKIPNYLTFMIGLSIALFVNYPGYKAMQGRFKAHAEPAIMMSAVIFGGGILLGVLEGSGMMEAMANSIVGIVPPFLGRYLHIIMGILSTPLAFFFSTDTYYYGVQPIVSSVAGTFGVDPVSVAMTMLVGRMTVCFVTPMLPATFLLCGLAGVEIGDHIKASFWWTFALSTAMILSGILLGVLPV